MQYYVKSRNKVENISTIDDYTEIHIPTTRMLERLHRSLDPQIIKWKKVEQQVLEMERKDVQKKREEQEKELAKQDKIYEAELYEDEINEAKEEIAADVFSFFYERLTEQGNRLNPVEISNFIKTSFEDIDFCIYDDDMHEVFLNIGIQMFANNQFYGNNIEKAIEDEKSMMHEFVLVFARQWVCDLENQLEPSCFTDSFRKRCLNV